MVLSVESQLDAVVPVALTQHPVRDAGVNEHVDAAVFEDAGTLCGADGLVAASFDDGGVDPRGVEQMREREPGRTCADDADLCLDDSAFHQLVLLQEL